MVMPIKAVTNTLAPLNRIKHVVKGDGIAIVAVAIPIYPDRREPKRAWRVLLDSGSNDNLIFTKSADAKSINPIKRTHPIVWGTSNGDFETTKVGNDNMKFTEFSRNKIFSVEPDIVILAKTLQLLLLT